MGCKRPLAAVTGACVLGMPAARAFVAPLLPKCGRSSQCLRSFPRAVGWRSCGQRRCLALMSNGGRNEDRNRKKIVFLGTPDVAASSLALLLEASRLGEGGGFDIVRAVSNPPAKAGRKKVLQPCPVQALADRERVPILTPATARADDFLSELEDLGPDLCITAAYGQFLPQRFLDIPKFGTLNIHPSLLPRYRGASPVQRCLEAGERETGVTVAFTVLRMDAGPVVRQKVRRLDGDEKTPQLLDELFVEGTKQLIDCLPSVWDGTVEKTPQDEAGAVKAAKLSISEARCCFKTTSAEIIHNRVRAFAGWPGTWAMFAWGAGSDPEERKIKLVTTAVGEAATGDGTEASPGGYGGRGQQVVLRGDALELACGDGSILRVLELQPLNKNVMGAKAFANGLRGAHMTWVELDPVEDVVAR